MNPICKTVARISIMYYLRISEVLNIQIKDIIEPDRVFVHGLKRSSGSIIYLPGLSYQINNLIDENVACKLFPISYNKCYRNYVKSGISFMGKNKKNTMRTHAHRYRVNELFQQGYSLNDLGDILKHKSHKSILYYLSS